MQAMMSFFVLVKIVYKSVGMGDSAAPRLAIAQRFGLPDHFIEYHLIGHLFIFQHRNEKFFVGQHIF